jgi:hypothetical protein
MCIAEHLISYAKHREKSYKAFGRFDARRARAVTSIRNVAGMHKGKEGGPWIRQIIEDIYAILPPRHGRYNKQREQILTLIEKYERINLSEESDGYGPGLVRTDQY